MKSRLTGFAPAAGARARAAIRAAARAQCAGRLRHGLKSVGSLGEPLSTVVT